MARPRMALAGLISALVLTTACTADASQEPFTGRVLDSPLPAPQTVLVDTDNEPYSLATDTDNRLTLVFFGYSNCPDICQTVMGSLSTGLNRLDPDDRDQVDLVFVTTDPSRDTPEALRDYLDRFDESGSFIGLTGDLDDIVAAGKPLAAYVDEGERLPSGGYDLGGHTSAVYAIDGTDTAPVVWRDDTSPAQYAADLTTLLEKA
ncbi:SCO family protein [Nocardioides salsibiostraticola]